jgi:hypothetical protein
MDRLTASEILGGDSVHGFSNGRLVEVFGRRISVFPYKYSIIKEYN